MPYTMITPIMRRTCLKSSLGMGLYSFVFTKPFFILNRDCTIRTSPIANMNAKIALGTDLESVPKPAMRALTFICVLLQ